MADIQYSVVFLTILPYSILSTMNKRFRSLNQQKAQYFSFKTKHIVQLPLTSWKHHIITAWKISEERFLSFNLQIFYEFPCCKARIRQTAFVQNVSEDACVFFPTNTEKFLWIVYITIVIESNVTPSKKGRNSPVPEDRTARKEIAITYSRISFTKKEGIWYTAIFGRRRKTLV